MKMINRTRMTRIRTDLNGFLKDFVSHFLISVYLFNPCRLEVPTFGIRVPFLNVMNSYIF